MTLLYVIGAIAALPLLIALIAYVVQNPKVWLGIVILLLPVYLADTGVGITWSEVVSTVIILGTILIWIVYKIANRYRFIRGWPDVLLIAFLLLSVVNIVPAMSNDVELDRWFAEWSLYLILLYYFPLRDYFGRSNADVKQLLWLCVIAVVMMAMYTAFDWVTRSGSGVIYAYQLIASRSRLFAPVFALGLTYAIALYFTGTTKKTRLLTFAFCILNLVGLVQSVTRSLWISVAVNILVIMCFFTFTQNLKFVVTGLLLAVATYATASIMYPKVTALAVRLLERRMADTKLTGGDRSFETRVFEVKSIWRDIKRYPISGSGIYSTFVSWDPIVGFHQKKPFVHIGYVGIIYKMGIGLSILLLATVAAFSIQSMATTWDLRHSTANNPVARGLAIGSFAFQPTLYAFIGVAGLFDQRYGNAMLAVSFALIAISKQLGSSDNTEDGQTTMPHLLTRTN